MRQNIYTTLGVRAIMNQSMMIDLFDFLISNRQFILPPGRRNELFKTRLLGQSPIAEITSKIVQLSKDSTFSLIKIPSKTIAVNEVIDTTFVPFDILQMKQIIPTHTKVLSVIPEINDKLIINITDILKANGEFSDVTQFQQRVIRDFLSRSFYTSSGNVWLSPALVRYVAKVYSMTIGGQLARFFNLSPLVQYFVQAVFCLFFTSKMMNPDLTHSFIKANLRAFGLGFNQDIDQILAFCEDTLGYKNPETLEDVFKIIDAYGHSQLQGPDGSRLNRLVLNAKFANWYPERPVSTIALEYPPYFLYLILLVLSNVRIGLSLSMKTLNLVKEGNEVIESVIRSPLLTSGI